MAADGAIVSRGDEIDDAEQNKWHHGQDDSGQPPLGRERSDLQANLGSVTDQPRQTRQDLGKVAPGLRLNVNRNDKKEQILLPNAAVKVLHGGLDVEAKGNLVGRHSELAADRVFHLLRHEAE